MSICVSVSHALASAAQLFIKKVLSSCTKMCKKIKKMKKNELKNEKNDNKKLKSFSFFDDYLTNCEELSRKEQDQMIVAITRYVLRGEQPNFKKKYLKSIFNCIKFSLDISISRSHSKENENQNEIKTESNQNQNEIKKESNKNQTQTKSKSKQNQIEMNKNKNENNINEYANAYSRRTERDERVWKTEFEFYLWCFGRLFLRDYRPTPERLKKYRLRRGEFGLVEILTSLQVMANIPFYRGERGHTRDGTDWRADPTWHLHSRENVNKFLEMPQAKETKEIMETKISELKREFWATKQEGHDDDRG